MVIIRQATSKLPADRAGLVVDVPLLDAGEAVGVGAGEDHVGPALQAHDALRESVQCDGDILTNITGSK